MKKHVIACATLAVSLMSMHLVNAQDTGTASTDIGFYKKFALDAQTALKNNDMKGVITALKAFETAWDQNESALKPKDPAKWKLVDKALDKALKPIEHGQPDPAKETKAVDDLLSKF